MPLFAGSQGWTGRISLLPGTGVSVGSFPGRGRMAPCREALSPHFRSGPAGEFAERVAVGAEDGQDALLGEKELLFGVSFSRLYKTFEKQK